MNNNIYKKKRQVINNTLNNVSQLTTILIILVMITFSSNYLNAQIAPTAIPSGGFEIDGGLVSGTPTIGSGDWLTGSSGGFVLNNNGTSVDPSKTYLSVDDYNSSLDMTFQGGKFNDDPNIWLWTRSKASSKNDINNAMYHLSSDLLNNSWLIVAGDRLSTNGTSYIDFEFLQNSLTKDNSGGFNSLGPDGGRTVNDIVLSMEYSNGGSNANVHMYFWKPYGSGFKYIEQVIPPNVAFAITNAVNENISFGAFGSNVYSPYQFVEAAINLTAFFGSVEPCLGVSIKSLMIKTKASDSESAALGDFVGPINVSLDFGTATINYEANLCCSGTTSVNQTGIAGGLYSSSPSGLSINSNTGEIDLANSSPGNYTITYSFVTNNCPKTVNTDITVSPLPSAPLSASADRNTVCSEDNGNITLTATGGSGSTLNWYSGSCHGTFLGSGNSISIPSPSVTTTYFASWENSCGISSCTKVTVTVSSSLSVTANGSSQVSCYNSTDGSISVSASGGTGSYTYSLNGGPSQNTNVFTGLSSGTYSIVVSDIYGCSATSTSININNPPQLKLSATGSSQVSCYNSNDGSVSASASGGTGAYSYSLNGGVTQSSNSFTGLVSGSYIITVYDENNCSTTAPAVSISNPATLSASATGSSQVSCYNSNDGSVSASASGGTGAYSYSLNGGTAQNSNTFTGLISGDYIITVYDENNCSTTASAVSISNPAMLSASATGSLQVSCYNSSDGSVSVSASGGTGIYSYSLNGGIPQSSNSFTGLASGSYIITVYDENLCSSESAPIFIDNPAILSVTANGSTQVSCFKDNDGVISVSTSGGTGAYSYSLNGGIPQSSNSFTGLASGLYTVSVYDENNCVATASPLTIANPQILTTTVSGSSQVSCYNSSDGLVSASATGGTGAYSYSLNGGTVQSSNTFSGLVSGSYIITVYDENNCSASSSAVVISNPDIISVSATGSSQVSCYNSNDGIVSATASGGTGVYLYSLNGGASQSSNTFTGLVSGNYIITVYDENNCAAVASAVSIANPAILNTSAIGSDQVSCNNVSDGIITVNATGGTGSYSYSLNGGQYQSSNTFDGLTSGSYIITVFDENNCEVYTPSFVISNPSNIAVSATGSPQVSCFNVSDGTITVSASGGTGSLFYSLNGGTSQSSNVFNNLSSGNYLITVYDENNCSALSSDININNPSLLTASVSGTSQVSCYNSSDGNIVISATGGTGAYSYSINGSQFQSSNVFDNLTSGTYNIVVFDENKCPANTNSFLISNPSQLDISATGSPQVSCYNSSDGSISVTVTGGTGAYSYSLNGGTSQSSNIFDGLASGSYIISVNDENNCSISSSSVSIANPEVIFSYTTASSQVSCANFSDGTITVTATGGTGSLLYSINGSPLQSSNIFNSLSSGTYIIKVLDENNCSFANNAVIINDPEKLSVSVAGSPQVSCFNVSDGIITATAFGGTGSYTYSLNGGTPQNSNIFNGLSYGSYIITAYDENNCAAYSSGLLISNPEQLSAFAVGSSQVTCHDFSDGSITITATGGTGAYSYSMNGGPAQSSNSFSGLSSGSFDVIVYDENNCKINTESIVIANPDPLSVYAVGSPQVSCNNVTDGSIVVTPSGGTGSYSYSLNGISEQSSNTFTGLGYGSYIITVFDENNCSINSQSVIISNAELMYVNTTGSSQVTCNNYNDGQIIVSATGGSGSYSYSLNGASEQSSNIFNGLPSGSYQITVYDQNNCFAYSAPITIANPEPLTVAASMSAQVTCHNAGDGFINAFAAGGTGAYTFSLNGSQAQSSSLFNGLTSGTYQVFAYDENLCSASTPALMINNPELISASLVESSPISCYNGNNGAIQVNAQGGTGSYTYSLNQGLFQASNQFHDLSAGYYSVVISDGNGCTTLSNSLSLVSPEPLMINAQQTNLTCFGENDASMEIDALGGTPPYQYSVDGGTTFQGSYSFEGLNAGLYTALVVDANNCISNNQLIKIIESASLETALNVVSGNKCFGVNDAAVEIVTLSDAENVSFSLDNSEFFTNNLVEGLSAGNHYIYVTNPDGCSYQTEFYIEPQQEIEVELVSSTYANCAGKRDGSLAIDVTGGQGPYNYQWSNGQSSSFIGNLDAGEFTLTVTDELGCNQYFSSEVYAGPVETELGMNNVFTPNGDGKNDLWVIDNLELYPDNQLVILNRWGNEVLTINGYQNNWDGSQLAEGTYFYILKVNMCDEYRTLDGYIAILR